MKFIVPLQACNPNEDSVSFGSCFATVVSFGSCFTTIYSSLNSS
jgi:hypothetical protein